MILDIYRYLYLLKTRNKDQPIDCMAAIYRYNTHFDFREREREREGVSMSGGERESVAAA